MKMPNFLCPSCRSPLVPGLPKKYCTLEEHVCDCPHGEDSSVEKRSTWVCPNRECEAHTGHFWSQDGEGPYKAVPYKTSPKWIDGIGVPFNSYHRQIEFQISYHDEDRRLRFGKWLTIVREIHYQSNDFGDKVGKRVRYTWWVRGTLWIPGWRMFLYSVRAIRRVRNDPTQLREEIKSTFDRAKWPRAQWWRRAVATWTRIFYRKYIKAFGLDRVLSPTPTTNPDFWERIARRARILMNSRKFK
jgi:hypothetical protein